MIRFLYDNLADPGALTFSSENIDFPAINIQHPFRTKPWRSSGIASEWLKWDLGSAKQVNCVAFLNTNFDGSSTIKFQGSATDSWGAPTVDETITFNSKIILVFFTGATLQWWRALMTNSSGSYIEVGRILFGSYFEPARNYNAGWSHHPVDPSKSTLTPGGQKHTDIKSQYSRVELPFKNISDAEKYDDYIKIIKTVGVHKDILLSLDAANRRNDLTFYGRFKNTPAFKNLFHGGAIRHGFKLEFEESL